MTKFDYENNSPVGYVDILLNGNANIEVVGYMDYHNDFHYLNSKERIEMFPPKGRVFAHNFIQRNNDLDKRLACICVIPNEKPGDNLDAFIWDKSESVYEFGMRITPIKANINEDGENNYVIFQENDLLETEEDKYILCGDKIYYIKANNKDRVIPYWNAASINIIETPYGRKYIDDYLLPDNDGVVDITNDDQLINWFMSKIFKKHWTEIIAGGSFKAVEHHLIAAFNDMKNLTTNVYESRLERLKRINTNFFMTLDELHDVADIPWVKNVIEQTAKVHMQSLISDVSAEYKDTLDKLKDEHNLMLEMESERYEDEVKKQKAHYDSTLKSIADDEAKLTATLDEKKFEIEILDETISTKKDEIAKTDELVKKANDRKENLVSDFAIIKDVLGLGQPSGTIPVQEHSLSRCSSLKLQVIQEADAECMMFDAYGKALEETLKVNKLPHQNATTIAESLAVYNVLLVPNVTYAVSIIHASHRCCYAVEYVNVGWKSFDDFWDEGLHSMVDSCKKEPEIMHYLILQNINLSYLPNFMQPLVDIQMGVASLLPSGYEYPENLRIICTITDDEVIPMSEQCLKYIGCIERPSKDTYVGKFKPHYDGARFGFLTPAKLAEKANATPSNFYKMYINE